MSFGQPIDKILSVSMCMPKAFEVVLTVQEYITKTRLFHYENKPIQVYWKFYTQKIENFQIKILIFFLFLLKNIDCGYSLEPPRRGGSNEYPNLCFEQK